MQYIFMETFVSWLLLWYCAFATQMSCRSDPGPRPTWTVKSYLRGVKSIAAPDDFLSHG